MIYTIGHKENYLAAIREHGAIQKLGRRPPGFFDDYPDGYPGGYAFKTIEDAKRGLVEEDEHVTWAVFGLEAEWERDTTPAKDGWWHELLNDANIIVLFETIR